MNIPGESCPSSLQLDTSTPLRLCGKKTSGGSCDSVTIATGGQSYQEVRGKIKAFQYGSPDAFQRYGSGADTSQDNIESYYVDGISITHGQSGQRNHVWTYAAAFSQFQDHLATCPGTGYGQGPPEFVKNSYFCSSGNPDLDWSAQLYNIPLWSNIKGNCIECVDDDLFFCVKLPASTTDDLELRLCTDEALYNEDVRIESINFYIR